MLGYSNEHTAAENASNAAPVPAFNIVHRPLTPEQRRQHILTVAQRLCEAEIEGKPWDVRLYADRLVEAAMEVRAGAA